MEIQKRVGLVAGKSDGLMGILFIIIIIKIIIIKIIPGNFGFAITKY